MTISGWADVPDRINYQGKLTDSGGNALDGTHIMTFYIYDAETGGSSLWNETQSVDVLAGIYNVKLGAITPLDVSLFTNEHIYSLYLQVVVDGEALSPRQRLSSTAFAMKAGDSDTLEGLGSTEFAGISHDHSFGEITGTATDAQIPNNITINNAATADYAFTADSADYADSAGDADTVDGWHASAFAEDVHQHSGSDITTGTVADTRIAASIARDGEVMGIVTANDGSGSGLDADMLDGLQASSFLNTSNDYGRSGVASNLYEGTSTLTNRYINDDSADTMQANTILNLFSAIQNGTGRAIYAESAGTKGIEGKATGANGAGVAGYCYATNGSGVFGQGDKRGVYGYVTTSNAYGVHGEATGANSWAGYFSGRLYASGNVGIGTDMPGAKLHVRHSDSGETPTNLTGLFVENNGTGNDYFVFQTATAGGGKSFSVTNSGRVGIGTTSPGYKLDVSGRARMRTGDDNSAGIWFTNADDSQSRGFFGMHEDDWLGFYGQAGAGWGLVFNVINGNVGIGTTTAAEKLTVRGNLLIQSESTGASVMELGEGLDYAEGFDVSHEEEINPGSVLIIDPDNPGKLTLSNTPYDTKVAGIVAGAKNLGSGVRLGVGQFDYDVALAGRVYCNVDATYGEVSPGDLLTSSPNPGYAMKVKDYTKAQGAILGKAMQRLEKGQKEQILVLVTLQ
jgi:hypothetical protein